MPGSKHFCFTLNNYNASELLLLRSLVHFNKVEYICWGFETGEQGTPHLQGFVSNLSRKTLARTKVLLQCPRIHLEQRRGTVSQAIDYCQKEGVFEEYGQRPSGQGSRNDLAAVKKSIDDGKRLREIADDHFTPFLKYHKGIQLYYSLKATPRNWETLVIVYWGSTGTGKTRSVIDNATDLYTHVGGQWFDGYMGQSQVLFDDFSGSCFKISYLLKLLDRYPMSVPIKGGFVNWCPREIYITSNLDPDIWYANAHPEHILALRRRFSFVFKFQ